MKSKLSLNIKVPPNQLNNSDEISKELLNNNTKSQCNHIINDIYLCGYEKSIDYQYLKTNKFTHIINCAGSSKRFQSAKFEDFKYLVLDIKDEPNFDILGNAVSTVIEFIKLADSVNQRKILIHCYEGISRAPTVLIAYLMWKYNLDKDKAYNYVKERRPCIDINLGFMFQLDQLGDFRKKDNTNYNYKEIVIVE